MTVPALPDAPHAFITGASGAIGGALARELRRRRPRARLTLTDVAMDSVKALGRELGGDVRVVACDLSKLEDIPPALDDAEASSGPIDLLASCAGIMDVRSIIGMPWERAELVMAVDLLAPLRLQQRLAGGMAARGRGWIINVTSMAGRVPLKGCAYYGAAKAGLAMASEVARAELAPRGVHVLTVYPGPVTSALEQGARSQYPQSIYTSALPTGDKDVLARLILDALARGEPRVVYPRAYRVGWRAGDLAARFTLAFGPDPRV